MRSETNQIERGRVVSVGDGSEEVAGEAPPPRAQTVLVLLRITGLVGVDDPGAGVGVWVGECVTGSECE